MKQAAFPSSIQETLQFYILAYLHGTYYIMDSFNNKDSSKYITFFWVNILNKFEKSLPSKKKISCIILMILQY